MKMNTIRIKSEYWEPAEPQACLINVEAIVAERGGELVLGWSITNNMPAPDAIYCEWNHHAVWRKPDGEVVCITPRMYVEAWGCWFGMREEFDFLPDPLALPTGTKPHRRMLSNKYVPLVRDESVISGCVHLSKSDDYLYAGIEDKGRLHHHKALDCLNKFLRRRGGRIKSECPPAIKQGYC